MTPHGPVSDERHARLGRYPWTIVPLERRSDYMAALEAASVRQDIRPFAGFLAGLVEAGLKGRAATPVPGGHGP